MGCHTRDSDWKPRCTQCTYYPLLWKHTFSAGLTSSFWFSSPSIWHQQLVWRNMSCSSRGPCPHSVSMASLAGCLVPASHKAIVVCCKHMGSYHPGSGCMCRMETSIWYMKYGIGCPSLLSLFLCIPESNLWREDQEEKVGTLRGERLAILGSSRPWFPVSLGKSC